MIWLKQLVKVMNLNQPRETLFKQIIVCPVLISIKKAMHPFWWLKVVYQINTINARNYITDLICSRKAVFIHYIFFS